MLRHGKNGMADVGIFETGNLTRFNLFSKFTQGKFTGRGMLKCEEDIQA
jgi:hypothetical protein